MRRRGGLWLLAASMIAVLLVSLFGGETVDGRYGLATDLAATLGYAVAVFVGAFPLALDRENRRSYLPSASPVPPWSWALGNALGAAIAVFTFALCLYVAAGIGAAARGGIDTYRVSRFERSGSLTLPSGPQPVSIELPPGTTHIRILPRTYLVEERAVGSRDAALIDVDGDSFEVHHDRPITLPVRNNPVLLRNRSPDFAVTLDLDSFRALYEERAFAPNAMLASIPPALGAAALAALGAAAGAHLGAPVAALVLTLLLLLASLRGFLIESIEYEGTLRRSRTEAHAGHDHGPPVDFDRPGRAFAKGAVRGMLELVPPIGELDRTGEVSIGEWVGTSRFLRGAIYLALALGFSGIVGGIGIHLRRTP